MEAQCSTVKSLTAPLGWADAWGRDSVFSDKSRKQTVSARGQASRRIDHV